MKTNQDKLVRISVAGRIHHPTARAGYRIDSHGVPRVMPGTGGIVYNYKVGDCCMDLVGDHIEPGVSLKNSDEAENTALQTYSCIGNKAVVMDGDAKGSVGFVTGKHGGIEHLLVYFAEEVLKNLKIGDMIQIEACGQGMAIEGFDDVRCLNLSPELFAKLDIKVVDGKLEVPVAAEVPAWLMGSGIGASSAYTGDYDIMTGDLDELKKYGLEDLRFGDLVLLKDCDNCYGRQFLKGSATLGVVVHSNCILSGHGPGVTALMSSQKDILKARITKDANLAHYFVEK